MTTKQTIREEWRSLNLKINSLIKTTETNKKAGINPTEEFMNWLKEMIAYRDSLTPLA